MALNHGHPWGFALDEIQVPVHFWFCGLDRSVPPAMGSDVLDELSRTGHEADE